MKMILKKPRIAFLIFFEKCENKKRIALFAGAGIGERVGLPAWKSFMFHLAAYAGKYNSNIETLIKSETEKGNYLYAASMYKLCRDIPEGEKFKQIAYPFRDPKNVQMLSSLMSLPFSVIFTTNYDRSLHDSYSLVKEKAPRTVELNDPTMKYPQFKTDFYIARLHGRMEVPESIIISDEDYNELKRNSFYLDFLRHIFTQFHCLFIGFSFLDPAIDNILKLIRERIEPSLLKLHLAVIPSNNNDQNLKSNLKRTNIHICEFDPSNNYKILWDAIDIVCSKLSADFKESEEKKEDKGKKIRPYDNIIKFISTSYARVKLRDEIQPLLEIVVDGIILNLLIEIKEKVNILKISEKLQKLLSLSKDESFELTEERVSKLCMKGWCRVEGEEIQLIKKEASELDKDLHILSKGVQDRYFLRSRQELKRDLKKIIEEILVTRGWDLGAHYSGASDGLPDVLSTLTAIIERECPDLNANQKKILILSFNELINRPDENEGRILGELGRISFGLQLVFNNPSSTINHKVLLPENIYLDASVLMPAIVEGHPLQPIYSDAINRLIEASRKANKKINIQVTEGFLNEIITHREKAFIEVDSICLENPDVLSKYLMQFGADNINVFIGAYGSQVERLKKKISFNQFMNSHAHYTTEIKLADYLQRLGIKTIKNNWESIEQKNYFVRLFNELKDAYQRDSKSWSDVKSLHLIKHEAYQLMLLVFDIKKGLDSFFITADKRFRKVVKRLGIEEVQQSLISHHALIQLVDLMIGINDESNSLSRIYWGGGYTEDSIMILNYYINRALSHRDEAMIKSLPEVLDVFTPKIIGEVKKQKICFSSHGDINGKNRMVKFLDRFENDFYSIMAEVVKKKYPEDLETVDFIRKENLRQNIDRLKLEVNALEKKKKQLVDEKDKKESDQKVAELLKSISELNKDLEL